LHDLKKKFNDLSLDSLSFNSKNKHFVNTMRRTVLLILLLVAGVSLGQDRGFKRVKLRAAGDIGSLYRASHALVIGNSNYSDAWPSLSGVDEDISEVTDALQFRGFNVVQAKDLNKYQLDSAITDFISEYGTNREAALLLYFAGHGHTVVTNYGDKLGYIVPIGAPNPNENPMAFQSNAMEMAQMEIYAKRIESKHALFVFDACFSGSVFSVSRAIPEVISYKTIQPVRQFITSGTEDEKVSDESVFRKQFVSAITTNDADFNEDGYLTGTELGRYLQSTVINYTQNNQHPQYGKMNNPALNKGDFVFTLNASDTSFTEQLGDGTKLSSPILNTNMGSIELTTELGGDLYLDGKLLAAISPNTIIPINDITEGIHSMEIIGTEKWSQEITVELNQTYRIFAKNYLEEEDDLPFIQMVYVQGGTFKMGDQDGDSDEQPTHAVTLNDFEISSHEISVSQFRAFINETGYKTEAEVEGWSWIYDGEWKKKSGYYWELNSKGEKKKDLEPVTFVSWNDSQRFAEWISEKYDSRFRLPTEAEWEYAARGGIHSGQYTHAGGDIAPLLGWFETNSEGTVHQVGLQRANELNLYDMSGNVWEWCVDWYGERYYSRSSSSNPKGILSGDYRVLRGGSYNNDEASGRIANRHKNRPNERDSFTGFRIVRETY
jgi:formylglycine-generating enzyme required for sulfatase activity